MVYNFTVTSPVALTAADILTLELTTTGDSNTQLAFTSAVSCGLAGSNATCAIDGGNANLLSVTTGIAIAANTATAMDVTSFVLTRSQNTPGTIVFNTYEVVGGINYLISTSTLQPAANASPGLITAASLVINDNGISSAQLDQATSFTVSISPTNLLTSTDFIVVTVPTEWTNTQTSTVLVTSTTNLSAMTGSLCTGGTVFCSNYLSDRSKIRVDDLTTTAFPSVTNISVTVASTVFSSPQAFAATYTDFSFETFSSTSALIDTSQATTTNTAAFSLACPNPTTFHCKTCNSTG